MSRPLRGLLLGSIALAFLYLLVHAREPLRLNIGDPWSDADVLSAVNDGVATSFIDVFYGAVGKLLGASDIGTFRLFALAWSGLATWLLFSYVRRLYSDRIALIATALFSTSLLWMMYADSIHQAPIMTAMMFLALWGLVRVIETKQRRHYAAACLGSFGALFTSRDCYIFLPVAVLVTVYLKAGNPFARGRRHLVAICAAGGVLAIAVKCLVVIRAAGWEVFVADLEAQLLERSASQSDRRFTLVVLPTLARRLTLVFTPFAWITAVFHALKAIRAPTVGAAIKDTAAWMLLAAVAFVALFPQLAASQMVAAQVFLPFYAIGSALVVDRLLERSMGFHRLAVAWLVAAPLWAFYILFTHPRSFLDRDDVAKTNAYLAANDHNDFVLSSLMSAGPVQASFQRHAWAALDADEPSDAAIRMMRIFEITGTDSVHEVIVKGPDSRFIDRSLWPLAMPRRQWSITGWPHLHRDKTRAVIAAYDRRVVTNLEAVPANKVLELSNYAVYRVDRAAVMAQLGEVVPATDHIDFTNLAATRHLLLGWEAPHVLPTEQIAVTTMEGFERCQAARTPHGNACKTIMTPSGLRTELAPKVFSAQLMIRVDRVCDLRLTFAFATQSYVRFTINGFAVTPTRGRTATFTVPAANLTPGINVIVLDPLLPRAFAIHLASLDLVPACPAP